MHVLLLSEQSLYFNAIHSVQHNMTFIIYIYIYIYLNYI